MRHILLLSVDTAKSYAGIGIATKYYCRQGSYSVAGCRINLYFRFKTVFGRKSNFGVICKTVLSLLLPLPVRHTTLLKRWQGKNWMRKDISCNNLKWHYPTS